MHTQIVIWILKILLALSPKPWRIPLAVRLGDRFRFGTTHTAQRARVLIWKAMGAAVGKEAKIGPGVFVAFPEKLQLGDHVSIQHGCFLSAFGGIRIGNHVSIAHDTSIISSSHPYRDVELIRDAPLEAQEVVIQDNVWIGMKCAITMGVTIGEGTVVGACSLVNKDLPAGVVAFGVPAKVRDERRSNSNP